jgi:hypothetical protein
MSQPTTGATCDLRGISTPPVRYAEETRSDRQARVRARFARDIDALSALGFRELCFYREEFGVFSCVIALPMALLMLIKREILGMDRRLHVAASFVLMYHNSPTTVVVPMGLGIKLYTSFTDRTLLISANFPSCAASHETLVIREAATMTVGEAWERHKQRIAELENDGKVVSRSAGFNQYVEWSHQEEAALV